MRALSEAACRVQMPIEKSVFKKRDACPFLGPNQKKGRRNLTKLTSAPN